MIDTRIDPLSELVAELGWLIPAADILAMLDSIEGRQTAEAPGATHWNSGYHAAIGAVRQWVTNQLPEGDERGIE